MVGGRRWGAGRRPRPRQGGREEECAERWRPARPRPPPLPQRGGRRRPKYPGAPPSPSPPIQPASDYPPTLADRRFFSVVAMLAPAFATGDGTGGVFLLVASPRVSRRASR